MKRIAGTIAAITVLICTMQGTHALDTHNTVTNEADSAAASSQNSDVPREIAQRIEIERECLERFQGKQYYDIQGKLTANPQLTLRALLRR